MGWTFLPRPPNVRQYLQKMLTWETERSRNTCLDIAMKLNVAYAAVERVEKETGERVVWAAVIAMRYIRGDELYNWGYKDMEEQMGPVQAECPERILDLLTPTDHEYAIDWRKRCRRAAERRMPKIGTEVRFREAVRFTDGSEESEFTVVKIGRRKRGLKNRQGRLFRISQRLWREREWSIVDR